MLCAENSSGLDTDTREIFQDGQKWLDSLKADLDEAKDDPDAQLDLFGKLNQKLALLKFKAREI